MKLRMPSPLDGAPDVPDAGHFFVASSLTLVAQGGSDLISGFHLGTLSVAGPSAIVGLVLYTVAVSRDVEGVSCEDLGWCVNSCLLHIFTAPATVCHFASSVVKPW
jgi:hypothetical protein